MKKLQSAVQSADGFGRVMAGVVLGFGALGVMVVRVATLEIYDALRRNFTGNNEKNSTDCKSTCGRSSDLESQSERLL